MNIVLGRTPRSATTRDAGRCRPRRRRTSCGCAPSPQAARAATAARWPTWRACLQRDDPLASLAHSTRASFLRQLGWHDRARGWDGRAMALAGSDQEAGADALIGLAADALGVGRFAASAAALRRAGELLAGSVPPRLPVRLAWVSAELAMARGDGADGGGPRPAGRRAGRSVRFGASRREIGGHPGRGAVQRRGDRGVPARRRRRACRRRATGNHPAALGVGLPAGRHRQRPSLGGRSAEDS